MDMFVDPIGFCACCWKDQFFSEKSKGMRRRDKRIALIVTLCLQNEFHVGGWVEHDSSYIYSQLTKVTIP
jgi:hypothetical protein